MSEEESGADKPHEATPERLRKARKEGQVAKSAELTSAFGYVGFFFFLLAGGGYVVAAIATPLIRLLSDAGSVQGGFGGQAAAVYRALWIAILALTIPLVAALLSVVLQRAFVVTLSNIQPKGSRISILSNAKQKYGMSGLFEFAKKAVKLCLFALLLGIFIARELDFILSLVNFQARQSMLALTQLAMKLFALVCLISVVVGGVDYLWQRFEHLKKNRMSHKELRDEIKESEGDPHFKGQRRQKGQEIALSTMLKDVADADVVMVNPTHYAVALSWNRSGDAPPKCVAKGVDEIALAIRREAERLEIPIREDPPTARALHASVEIGESIMPEHYMAVAAAIRFADDLRMRRRKR